MSTLAHSRTGAGEPLVLLHGIGLSRSAWSPVVPALAEHFDVIAVDLPGFGRSAPLPTTVEPTPAALAHAVAGLVDDLGLTAPHVVGNSLGGWVGLELAAVRPVASLTLLSPAGLWRGGTPVYDRVSLRLTRWFSRHGGAVLNRAVATGRGRALVFAQILGRPTRMTAEQARGAIRDIASGPGFDPTLRATARRHYRSDAPIEAPVTVAFGSRDRLLLPFQSRHLDQLPPGAHVAELPECGHVPMTDDPEAVVSLIIASTARAAPAAGGRGGPDAGAAVD